MCIYKSICKHLWMVLILDRCVCVMCELYNQIVMAAFHVIETPSAMQNL